MSFTRKQRHFLVIWLVLASVFYRGLIPAGFMPSATGAATRHGALLVICHHGEFATHEQGANGSGAGTTSLDQCPFGAAAGPALPSVKIAFSFAPGLADFRLGWSAVLNRSASPQLQPPARGPPTLS
ncbi:MAG: hypothetical protein ACRESS_04340 [Stenotrophobium sp.]